jgi:hypothetical protein
MTRALPHQALLLAALLLAACATSSPASHTWEETELPREVLIRKAFELALRFDIAGPLRLLPSGASARSSASRSLTPRDGDTNS